MSNDDKPNPEEYKAAMRASLAGEQMRVDDYVGSHTSATNSTGRVKLDKKKWTPAKNQDVGDAFRSDEWMGSGKTQRQSWKPKSSRNVTKADEASKPGEFVRSSSEKVRKWTPPSKDQAIPPPWMGSPTATSSSPRKEWKPKSPAPKPKPVNLDDKEAEIEPTEVNKDVDSDNENFEVASDDEVEAPAAAAPAPAAGAAGIDIYDKPNPEEYKTVMRTARASDDSGMRVDDYVGAHTGANNTGRTKLEKKKWTPSKKPEAGDNPFRVDEWMGSGKTTRKSWKPKSPAKKTAENVEMSHSDLQSGSNHSHDEKDAVDRLSGSMNHVSLASPKDEAEKAWQSHGALNHRPHVDHGKEEESEEIAPVKKDKDGDSDNEDFEVPSDDEAEAEAEAPAAKPEVPAPAPTAPAPAAGDDDKPNPEEYKAAMRASLAGEQMRVDDYVGSHTSGTNSTGRVKLDKKKWTPAKNQDVGDAFRSDEWLGSGKTQRKSYTVKK
jgi:hypothetical protein